MERHWSGMVRASKAYPETLKGLSHFTQLQDSKINVDRLGKQGWSDGSESMPIAGDGPWLMRRIYRSLSVDTLICGLKDRVVHTVGKLVDWYPQLEGSLDHFIRGIPTCGIVTNQFQNLLAIVVGPVASLVLGKSPLALATFVDPDHNIMKPSQSVTLPPLSKFFFVTFLQGVELLLHQFGISAKRKLPRHKVDDVAETMETILRNKPKYCPQCLNSSVIVACVVGDGIASLSMQVV